MKLQYTWPCAIRVRNLLNGAQVQLDDLSALSHGPGRRKRPIDEALGQDRNPDILQRQAFGGPSGSTPGHLDVPGFEDDGGRMMAHVMGFSLPGTQPSTSFYPGYEWWPYNMTGIPEYGMAEGTAYSNGPEETGGVPPDAPFTFDEAQYSPSFVQSVRPPNPDAYQFPPGHR